MEILFPLYDKHRSKQFGRRAMSEDSSPRFQVSLATHVCVLLIFLILVKKSTSPRKIISLKIVRQVFHIVRFP